MRFVCSVVWVCVSFLQKGIVISSLLVVVVCPQRVSDRTFFRFFSGLLLLLLFSPHDCSFHTRTHTRTSEMTDQSRGEHADTGAATAAAAAAGPDIKIRQGWLTKEGAKWKTWKRRWFMLNEANTRLYYYSSKREVADVCGSTCNRCC